MPTKEEAIQIIKTVYDPEIPVNVYDLGLIYDVTATEESIRVQMTLTSPGCPLAQQIPAMVRNSLQTQLNAQNVQVDVVWDPPWNPSMISEDGKKLLQMGGTGEEY